jgi:hypothetical protein
MTHEVDDVCPKSHNGLHCWHPTTDELGYGTRLQRCCHCGGVRESPPHGMYKPRLASYDDDMASTGPWGPYDY